MQQLMTHYRHLLTEGPHISKFQIVQHVCFHVDRDQFKKCCSCGGVKTGRSLSQSKNWAEPQSELYFLI